jgi:hypothetical protein
MPRTRLPLGLLVISMFFSSCSPLKPVLQPLPSPTSKWTVELNQSGGIAGVLLSVEVTNDGQLKAEDQRSNRTVTQTLSAQTTAKLNQLVSNAILSSRSVPKSACADCFIYDLEIQSETSDLHIQADNTTMNESGAAELINYLSKLRDDALAAHP